MVEGLTTIYQWMWIPYDQSEIGDPMSGHPTRRTTSAVGGWFGKSAQASAVLNVHGCDLRYRTLTFKARASRPRDPF